MARMTAEQVAEEIQARVYMFADPRHQTAGAYGWCADMVRANLIETPEQRRERFEAWRRFQWGNLTEHDLDRDEDGMYVSGEVQDQFATFNAGATWNAPASDVAAERLAKHCEDAAAIVATWPEWKRNILRHSGEPTNSEPRRPIDNASDGKAGG